MYTMLISGALLIAGCSIVPKNSNPDSTNPDWLTDLVTEKSTYSEMYSYDKLIDQQDQAPESKRIESILYDKLNRPLSSLDDWSLPQSTISNNNYTSDEKSPTNLGTQTVSQQEKMSPVSVLINNSVTNDKEKMEQAPLIIAPPKLSRIENLYNSSSELCNGKRIRQFGYDVLSSPQKNVIPSVTKTESTSAKQLINDSSYNQEGIPNIQDNENLMTSGAIQGPVDPEYVIGAGDEIKIKCSGGVEINSSYTVNRDGAIFLPRIGSIFVASVKFQELKKIINTAISKQFQNYTIEVSLGQLHTIRIMVSGYLNKPGFVTIPSNSTLLDALSAAGGPNKNGTLRNFRLTRKGQSDMFFDLYTLLTGNGQGGDITIIGGDQISVGRIGNTVSVISPERTAIYELKDRQTLKMLIDEMGGVSNFTNIKSVVVERTMQNSLRAVEKVNFQMSSHYYLKDSDVILFKAVDKNVDNTVAITGPVVRPGTFPFAEGMRISDLLKFAEGFLVQASLERAVILRELGETDSYDQMLGDDKGRIKEQVIWIDLTAIIEGDTIVDIPLRRLDRLKILSKDDTYSKPTVSIIGAVKKPGEYKRSSGLRLGDLINIAGGPADDAYSGSGTIVRRKHAQDAKHFDIEHIPFELQKVLDGGLEAFIKIENFDQVVVRRVQTLQVGVTVTGQVQFPGQYILPEGSKISAMLAAAGGLLPGADLGASYFTRQRVKQIQKQRLQNLVVRMQESFERGKQMVTREGSSGESYAGIMNNQNLKKMSLNMQSIQPTGRVIVDITQESFLMSDENLVLEDGDSIIIPKKMKTVTIMGRVRSPNVFIWKPGVSIDDYINKTGGYEDDAKKSDIYVIKANGEVRATSQTIYGRIFTSYDLVHGDTILIPASGPERSARKVFDDYIRSMRNATALGISGGTMQKVLGSSTPTPELQIGSEVNVSESYESDTKASYSTQDDTD